LQSHQTWRPTQSGKEKENIAKKIKEKKESKKTQNGKYISRLPNIAARDGFADLMVVQ
jgi:hypothetical protein